MNQTLPAFLALSLAACGAGNKPFRGATDRLDQLKAVQTERIDEGMTYTDNEHGWITPTDCDGMIFSAKFAVASGHGNILAAEYPDEPGRFGRRPQPWCYSDDEGHNGSVSSWSRDMAICGLIPYAYQTNQREILERHINYVEANGDYSGYPRNLDRTFYTPTLRGTIYQVIYSLGGKNQQIRHTPNPATLTSGLSDYRAHLLMCDIWLSGETRGSLDQFQMARINEHAKREPNNIFYQVLHARWNGDFDHAINLCSSRDRNQASYVRCNEPRACYLAEEAWSCSLLIDLLSVPD